MKLTFFRRGHVRNLWTAAGVDRSHVPRSPRHRFWYAREQSARSVYVRPHWIGRERGLT